MTMPARPPVLHRFFLPACSMYPPLLLPPSCQALPVLVERPFLLFTLNEYLARTALLVQPVRLTGGAAASQLSDTPALPTIDVPLPLRPAGGEVAGAAQAAPAGGGGWNAFEQPEAAPAAGDGGAGGSSAAAQQGERAVGYLPGGETQEVALPAGLTPALHRLGLGSSPGFLRLVQASAAEVTAQGAASGGDGSAAGGEGGASEERWLPLALWLGMPMQPSALCQAVCDASLAARFLEPKARQRQREGQATLSAALAALAASHGACSTAFAGERGEQDGHGQGDVTPGGRAEPGAHRACPRRRRCRRRPAR